MTLQPVMYIRSDISRSCSCGFKSHNDDLGGFASHLINQHGYKLIHAGQETSKLPNDDLWQSTVMVLTNQ